MAEIMTIEGFDLGDLENIGGRQSHRGPYMFADAGTGNFYSGVAADLKRLEYFLISQQQQERMKGGGDYAKVTKALGMTRELKGLAQSLAVAPNPGTAKAFDDRSKELQKLVKPGFFDGLGGVEGWGADAFSLLSKVGAVSEKVSGVTQVITGKTPTAAPGAEVYPTTYQAPGGLPGWVIPVGLGVLAIGGIAVFAMMRKKSAAIAEYEEDVGDCFACTR